MAILSTPDGRLSEVADEPKPMPEPGSLKWKPMLNDMLVHVDPQSLTTESGIVLPNVPVGAYATGTVIEIGPGTYAEDGSTVPCLLKPGDRVMFIVRNKAGESAHPSLKIDGYELLRLRDVDCSFVFRDAANS